MTKRYCEQRGSSLTTYGNVMYSNAGEDTALYFLGKKFFEQNNEKEQRYEPSNNSLISNK